MAFEKNNEYAFKKGESGHPAVGLPKRVRRSKLRKLLDEIYEITPLAMQNIKDSVEGKEVNKDVLQTSKWCVERCAALTTAAISEEDKNAALKIKHQEAGQTEDEEIEKDEATPKPARFQLTVVE